MKKMFVAAIATVAVLTGIPVHAADLPVKAPALATVPVAASGWTGFYAGFNGGYGWSDATFSFLGNDPISQRATCGGPAAAPNGTCAPASFVMRGGGFGGQAGYNWQFDRRWLFGVEADFDWSNLRGRSASAFVFGGSPATFRATETIQWFGTVRTRLGVLAADNWLFYATGGLAYGQIKRSAAIDIPGTFFGGNPIYGYDCRGSADSSNCFVGASSRTAAGFTVGAGTEYALAGNISVRVEYLYVNLGRGGTLTAASVPTVGRQPSSFAVTSSPADFNVVRAGVSYRF